MDQPHLGRFGDRRLAATGDALLAAMQKERTMCLTALSNDREEMRRFNEFLDNEAVTRHEMLVQAGRLTARRAAGRREEQEPRAAVDLVEDTARSDGRRREAQHRLVEASCAREVLGRDRRVNACR